MIGVNLLQVIWEKEGARVGGFEETVTDVQTGLEGGCTLEQHLKKY